MLNVNHWQRSFPPSGGSRTRRRQLDAAGDDAHDGTARPTGRSHPGHSSPGGRGEAIHLIGRLFDASRGRRHRLCELCRADRSRRAAIVAIASDLDIASAQARPGGNGRIRADRSGAAELGADSGELHAAVAALLADAWCDADPRRQFSPSLRALAKAYAGNSHATLVQAARSLLFVLGWEPLTCSPVVPETAGRLRRLFPAGRRPAMG